MNILAIGAHPDDIELCCAGTLARYVKQGHAVSLAVFTCGDMGDLEIPPAKLAQIRKEEAEAAAAVLGASLLWPAVTDELVFPNEAQRRIMIDLLRQADPDVIITHSPNDYHPDHRYVSQLVFDSYFQKGLAFLVGTRPIGNGLWPDGFIVGREAWSARNAPSVNLGQDNSECLCD